MSTQIYCTLTDVEAAWTPADLLAAVDDDASGTLSAGEQSIVTRAIERGANRMNASLEMRYSLDSLANNAWCRDCNAAVAIYLLSTRNGAAATDAIQEQYEAYVLDLEHILAGRLRVPQATETLQHTPTVTNFAVDPTQAVATVRRLDDVSTGELPSGSVKSFHDFE